MIKDLYSYIDKGFLSIARDGNYQKLKSYNFKKNLYEAEEGKSVVTTRPVSVYLDVNLKCNLMCPSCFRSAPDSRGKVWPTMDFTLFEKLAHELFPTAYKVILSGGGESILNKDFDKMIELCLHYQVRPVLYTNATTLNRQRITLLARSGTFMGISMDGAKEKTFEKLRYPAKWQTIIKSLDTIKEVRDEVKNEEFYPYLGVVIQRDNIKELTTFVELAEHYSFDLIKFSRLELYYPELEQKILDPDEADRELVKVLDMANQKRIRLYVPDYGDTSMCEKVRALREKNMNFTIKLDKNNPDSFPKYPTWDSKNCQIPWSETLITPEGKVNVGCCSGFELGDINKIDFSQIWNSKIYKQLRRKVNSDQPMEFCKYDICPFRK
jgi:MoaA/NifB/PqqE/SkfB family radical SAM enzyme